MDDAVDLSLIGRQLRQLNADVAAMRNDMAVLTAIAMRQDGTMTAVLQELRAMHSQTRCSHRIVCSR